MLDGFQREKHNFRDIRQTIFKKSPSAKGVVSVAIRWECSYFASTADTGVLSENIQFLGHLRPLKLHICPINQNCYFIVNCSNSKPVRDMRTLTLISFYNVLQLYIRSFPKQVERTVSAFHSFARCRGHSVKLSEGEGRDGKFSIFQSCVWRAWMLYWVGLIVWLTTCASRKRPTASRRQTESYV